MQCELNVLSKICNYKIEFVSSLESIISEIDKENTIVFIDSNVASLYPFLVSDSSILVECIEDSKTINGVLSVLSELTERKSNIQTKILVIGGGILQDLVGFCASIYCRGIEYVLVPTTLLSQVDSCVGGKTSINFNDRKNILGTFYPPSKILIYTNFIDTLSLIEHISGLGEIYKFNILQNTIDNFNTENITDMIRSGLEYKIDILSRDEFDTGERKFLNFGHTFGHAIESISEYKVPHGICVILGSMVAIQISHRLGYTVNDRTKILDIGRSLLSQSGINFDKNWFIFERLFDIIKSDKKSTGKLTMILIDSEPVIRDVENTEIMQELLDEFYESI